MCTSPILFAPLKKCIHNTTSKCTFRQTGLIHTVIQNLGILHCFVIWTMVVKGHKQTNDGQTVFEKGAYFFPASGVILSFWPYNSKIKHCFWNKKISFGMPKYFHFYVSLFFMLLYHATKYIRNQDTSFHFLSTVMGP